MKKIIFGMITVLFLIALTSCNQESAEISSHSDHTIPDNFIFVKGGSFSMGDTRISPQAHTVTVSDIYVCENEVTQSEWYDVMETNPSYFIDSKKPVETVSWYDAIVYCNKRSIKEGLVPCYRLNGYTNPANWGDVPVDSDSTWDALQCKWNANGYRLPTEAEWEYVAKGGLYARPYQYSGSDSLDWVGWYQSNSASMTHRIKTKAPNSLALYDLSGNVSEWVWDWRADYPLNNQENPHGALIGESRVVRGGSWGEAEEYATNTFRTNCMPNIRTSRIGFRVVRNR